MSAAFKNKLDEQTVSRQPLSLPTKIEAVAFAVANTAIEGLSVSHEAQNLLKMWAEGNLSDEELLSFSTGARMGYAPSHGR